MNWDRAREYQKCRGGDVIQLLFCVDSLEFFYVLVSDFPYVYVKFGMFSYLCLQAVSLVSYVFVIFKCDFNVSVVIEWGVITDGPITNFIA